MRGPHLSSFPLSSWLPIPQYLDISTSYDTPIYNHPDLNKTYIQFNKMSAIEESSDGPIEVIQVLIVLHPSFGAQELCGPLEVLSNAHHKLKDPGKRHFLSLLSFQLLN